MNYSKNTMTQEFVDIFVILFIFITSTIAHIARDFNPREIYKETVITRRIVSDSSVIHSPDGVPVDFEYNETKSADSENLATNGVLSSAPGCPKTIQDIPWLYHGNPPKCYLVGTAGPCPFGHLLFGNGTSHYAHCDCMCGPSASQVKIGYTRGRGWLGDVYDVHINEYPTALFCSVKDVPEMNEAVWDIGKNTCYFLDTQGPCRAGEWLAKDNKQPGSIKCVPRCSLETGPFQTSVFYDWQAGKCENVGVKSSISVILPVSLAVSVGQNGCDDGKVYSKTLHKCIPESKAFILKLS